MVTEIGVAIIRNDIGQILICKRPKGSHLELLWEFPGGKIEKNESVEECIIRECKEELDVIVKVEEKYTEINHDYEDRKLKLIFYFCSIKSGKPTKREHNEIVWANKKDLLSYNFCPADYSIIKNLID